MDGDETNFFSLSTRVEKRSPEVVNCVEKHFTIQHNVVYARAKFNTRNQRKGESANKYFAAVSSLAEHCHFGSLKDELIRDRIVVGIKHKELSEQLIYKSDLTLDQTLDIVRMFEERLGEYLKLNQAKNDCNPGKKRRRKRNKKKHLKLDENLKLNEASNGETMNEFIAAVSSLAEHCNFGSLKEEFIQDRIIGIRNKALVEQLVFRVDLTLEQTLNIVRMFKSRSVPNVLLHKASNPWKPHNIMTNAELNKEEFKTEYLYRRFRGILNKLTPQKFVMLVKQAAELPIDTESRLKGVIDMLFEKAVDEPKFCFLYANMCRHLMKKAVPSDADENRNVNFRKLLLIKCQREFERDINDEINRDNRIKQIEEASEDEKKKIKEELEDEERKVRRRCLGNIRFIGELYKISMLTAGIMHNCLNKLLKQGGENSLECLCTLMTTIGKELDETSKQDEENINKPMDFYFKSMKVIVDSRKTSSRVRFILQDVMDLRLRNWVPRREDNNPKTIKQIHIEAQREAEIQQIQAQQPLQITLPNTVEDRDIMISKWILLQM